MKNIEIYDVNQFSEYECDGYNVCRLRSLKEDLLRFPAKAKIAIEIMYFSAKNVIQDAKLRESIYKHPLTHLGHYFYSSYNSISDFLQVQIDAIESNMESTRAYVATIKPTKSNLKSIDRWTKSIEHNAAEIERLKTLIN